MKDAYYFSHDSNAHKDTKCIRLRRLAGMAGYGLFWCIIEMLRDTPEFKMPMTCVEDILFELRCDAEHWNALFESGLIQTDGEYFWSASLNRRMARYLDKREQRSKAGKRSAEARATSTSVERPLNDNSTSVEHPLNEVSTKFNKVKESKVKENIYAQGRTAEAEAPATYSDTFEQFWASYPRHIDKKRAYKAWAARLKAGFAPEAMISAANKYAAACKKNGTEEKFIKHPSTFIGPDLAFTEWEQKEAEDDGLNESDWPEDGFEPRQIEDMHPDQRTNYDGEMTRAQKEYYDACHPRDRRLKDASAA